MFVIIFWYLAEFVPQNKQVKNSRGGGEKKMFVYWTKYKARSWGEISVFKPFSPMEQDMLLEAVRKGRHAHA